MRKFGQYVSAHGARSRYADWFRTDPDTGEHRTFEGHHHLVALNHDQPEVADYVTEVLEHWLERGVAGWRFDAA